MALIDIKVPDIGDFAEVAVIELMVKVGDTIAVDQSIITVESDKASMEIPSSHAGVVKEVKVAIGGKVKEGTVVLSLEVAGEAANPAPVAAAAPASAPAPAAQAAPVVVAPAAMASGPVEVKVPDIGDFKDVAVIEIFVKVGDTIKLEQSLMTVESDKAAMEIPSSAAGVVKELKVKLGDKVNIGDLIAVLEGAGVAVVASSTPASSPSCSAASCSRNRNHCICTNNICSSACTNHQYLELAIRFAVRAQIRARIGCAIGRGERHWLEGSHHRSRRAALHPRCDVWCY